MKTTSTSQEATLRDTHSLPKRYENAIPNTS